jgi:hypothetical protein
MTPFIRITRGLSSRWFVHRWHAAREFHAWHDRRARVGATISVGSWRVNMAILRTKARPR